eukprot:TRINITY_DN8002_c0_g1_i1.p1 TRINITY_DN8002_c0_g1~~TRINITY_DN8002_c0_g1_i1.p1  ORF type:complete len:263 (-),score=86.76 TRINITY_DN8002_c0_g1_i1:101-865(-)
MEEQLLIKTDERPRPTGKRQVKPPSRPAREQRRRHLGTPDNLDVNLTVTTVSKVRKPYPPAPHKEHNVFAIEKSPSTDPLSFSGRKKKVEPPKRSVYTTDYYPWQVLPPASHAGAAPVAMVMESTKGDPTSLPELAPTRKCNVEKAQKTALAEQKDTRPPKSDKPAKQRQLTSHIVAFDESSGLADALQQKSASDQLKQEQTAATAVHKRVIDTKRAKKLQTEDMFHERQKQVLDREDGRLKCMADRIKNRGNK